MIEPKRLSGQGATAICFLTLALSVVIGVEGPLQRLPVLVVCYITSASERVRRYGAFAGCDGVCGVDGAEKLLAEPVALLCAV